MDQQQQPQREPTRGFVVRLLKAFIFLVVFIWVLVVFIWEFVVRLLRAFRGFLVLFVAGVRARERARWRRTRWWRILQSLKASVVNLHTRRSIRRLLGAFIVGTAALFVINYFFIHRSLWDWLQLLIVPAVLAGASVWFNRQQRAREQEIENQRAGEAAFQAYLDQMGQMLTSKEQPLQTAKPGDNLSAVARARTLSILRRLSGFGRHKGSIVMFLYEARLITTKDGPIVNLGGADLTRLSMSMVGDDTGLKAGLKGKGVSLREIDLSRCRLISASFSGVDLSAANLSGALLWYAALDNCLLDGANLSDASMWEAQLFGADLREANLSKADLDLADLRQADLTGADLTGADLTGADLTGADLTGADLRQATGWNEEQLEHAESLQDVTMPNGQKYEEWLKDKVERGEHLTDRQKADLEQYDEYLRNLKEASKEDRGEDGENSGPS